MSAPVHDRMWKVENLTSVDSKGAKGGPFVSRKVICDHCTNGGLVLLDQTDTAVPCPMCQVGMVKHIKFADEGAPSSERFWSLWDVRDVSWEGGRTVDHWKCYDCETFLTQPIYAHKAECAELQAASKTTAVHRSRMLEAALVKAAKAADVDRAELREMREQEQRQAAAAEAVRQKARQELLAFNEARDKRFAETEAGGKVPA